MVLRPPVRHLSEGPRQERPDEHERGVGRLSAITGDVGGGATATVVPAGLRVRLVVPEYLPERAGATVHVAALARALSMGGHDVVVATQHPLGSRLPDHEVGADGVRVRRFASAGRVAGHEISPALWRWLREGADGADVVHVHDVHALTSLLAMAVAPRPVVLTPHHRPPGEGGSEALVRQVHAVASRRALRRVSRIICASPSEAAAFAGRLGAAERVVTVAPGEEGAAVARGCYGGLVASAGR